MDSPSSPFWRNCSIVSLIPIGSLGSLNCWLRILLIVSGSWEELSTEFGACDPDLVIALHQALCNSWKKSCTWASPLPEVSLDVNRASRNAVSPLSQVIRFSKWDN